MMFIHGSSTDISRRALYVGYFAYFDFKKQSGQAFQVISQCTNKASRKTLVTGKSQLN